MQTGKSKNRKAKTKSVIATSSRYAIGALPYRFGIRMPLLVGENGLPDRLMKDRDIEERLKTIKTLREFVLKFLETYDEFHNYKDEVYGIQIPKDEVDASVPNEIRCVICAGKYGYESELYNVTTMETKKRAVDDCELMPFPCRIVFNPPHQLFIVIFEKFGNSSCVSAFVRALSDYVQMSFKDKGYRVDYGYITNLKYVMQRFKNNVKAIHLIQYKKGGVLEDLLDYDDDSQEVVKVDVKISASRGGVLKLVDKFRDFTQKGFSGVVLCNEQYPEMNLELKAGPKTQTVPMGKDSFQVPFDITNEVFCDASTGRPTCKDFCNAVQACLKMSRETVYRENKENESSSAKN